MPCLREVEALREGERAGNNGQMVEQSEHTQHSSIQFIVTYGRGPGKNFQNSYNNNRDHGSQVTITNTIIESVKIVKELAKCDTGTQSEQTLLGMASTDLLATRLPLSSICRKCSYLVVII